MWFVIRSNDNGYSFEHYMLLDCFADLRPGVSSEAIKVLYKILLIVLYENLSIDILSISAILLVQHQSRAGM